MIEKILALVGMFALFARLAAGDETSMTDKDRLRAAVQTGQLDTVTELLKKGVDPNASPDISLLSIAIGKGNPAMVEVLLKAGTKVNVPIPGPPPPLDVAMMASNGRVFDLMMATMTS